MQARCPRRWKFESYSQEQHAVEKLSTALLGGLSPSNTLIVWGNGGFGPTSHGHASASAAEQTGPALPSGCWLRVPIYQDQLLSPLPKLPGNTTIVAAPLLSVRLAIGCSVETETQLMLSRTSSWRCVERPTPRLSPSGSGMTRSEKPTN
jgi:hypothetical protein